jgi:hypothetical protein
MNMNDQSVSFIAYQSNRVAFFVRFNNQEGTGTSPGYCHLLAAGDI